MVTFTKIIFFVLIIGIVFTGFIRLGSEITDNSNLDNNTEIYLQNLNEAIQPIENLEINETEITTGEADSFSKQYKEAKKYAQTASGAIGVLGDIPQIFITTANIEQEENSWFLNYLYVGTSLLIFAVVFYLLFGRKA